MRPQAEVDQVLSLIGEGRSDTEIARLTRVPRTTIRDWRLGFRDLTNRVTGSGDCPEDHEFSQLPSAAYAYLLGLYLGDGYIARHPRVWKLRITMDQQYPEIIAECARTMEALMPGQEAHVLERQTRCVEVSMYSKHWPCLLPQHGPGRKHQREIALANWQERLINEAPESFVRGLIHSDGCRVVTLDRGVTSVRYHFSNRSEDIKGLLCGYLDELGIRWTRPSELHVAVYRQGDVKRLDTFIGPKR